ncbi:hypothetical protein ACFOKF_06730 [Sphingobium rhizovicinum]|uniref:Uncharacterized protein n=1 Tax=Sphingobium rhizovicinum TaxID=432308 RepID=A0ABV7NCB9_9SPHN
MAELPRYWSVVSRKTGRPEVPGRYHEIMAMIQGGISGLMLLSVGIYSLFIDAPAEILIWTLGGGLFCAVVGIWQWRRARRKRLAAEAVLADYLKAIAQPIEQDWATAER